MHREDVRLSVVSCQGLSNELADSGLVPHAHLLLGDKRFCPPGHRAPWQREHLERRSVKSVDQPLSGRKILIGTDAQKSKSLVGALLGEPIAVGHHHRKEVEQNFVVAEGGPEAMARETMLDEGKACGDGAHPTGTQWRSLDHGSPPWGHNV